MPAVQTITTFLDFELPDSWRYSKSIKAVFFGGKWGPCGRIIFYLDDTGNIYQTQIDEIDGFKVGKKFRKVLGMRPGFTHWPLELSKPHIPALIEFLCKYSDQITGEVWTDDGDVSCVFTAHKSARAIKLCNPIN